MLYTSLHDKVASKNIDCRTLLHILRQENIEVLSNLDRPTSSLTPKFGLQPCFDMSQLQLSIKLGRSMFRQSSYSMAGKILWMGSWDKPVMLECNPYRRSCKLKGSLSLWLQALLDCISTLVAFILCSCSELSESWLIAERPVHNAFRLDHRSNF